MRACARQRQVAQRRRRVARPGGDFVAGAAETGSGRMTRPGTPARGLANRRNGYGSSMRRKVRRRSGRGKRLRGKTDRRHRRAATSPLRYTTLTQAPLERVDPPGRSGPSMQAGRARSANSGNRRADTNGDCAGDEPSEPLPRCGGGWCTSARRAAPRALLRPRHPPPGRPLGPARAADAARAGARRRGLAGRCWPALLGLAAGLCVTAMTWPPR